MPRRDLDEWFWQVGTELQRLSEEMIRSGPTLASRRYWEPRVDLLEDGENFVIKAEIAGVRGEDVQLIYIPDRHSVLLRGTRHEQDFLDTSRIGCYQLEIYYGEFEREIQLPHRAVDAEGIRAHYKNGLLLIVVPKAAEE
jgi:HSP20 family protein